MSGTSADGVDAGAFDIRRVNGRLFVHPLASSKTTYGSGLKDELTGFWPGTPIDFVMRLDILVGKVFGRAAVKVMALLAKRGLKAELIGSHGQTLHHMPDDGATLQIGSAAKIVSIAQIGVWSDFRLADMAAGGQGAPLAPVAHLHLFGHDKENRAVVNIGGIANITHIPAGAKSLRDLTAYDTGPGNMLIDVVTRKITGKPFDRNGGLASKGVVDATLIRKANFHPFFRREPPKSTGRDVFGRAFFDWLFPKGRIRWNADLAATMTELTAASVGWEIERLALAGKPSDRVIICGGGARNGYLMKRLAALCAPVPVESSDVAGIDPGQVETALIAILAFHADRREALDLSAITGARRPVRLGVFTPAP
jgi:anhydro-N-acetylmuramic acid kinase